MRASQTRATRTALPNDSAASTAVAGSAPRDAHSARSCAARRQTEAAAPVRAAPAEEALGDGATSARRCAGSPF